MKKIQKVRGFFTLSKELNDRFYRVLRLKYAVRKHTGGCRLAKENIFVALLEAWVEREEKTIDKAAKQLRQNT